MSNKITLVVRFHMDESVLVQREMESWRAPLASIAPIPPAKFATPSGGGRRKGQRLKLQLVSKGRSGWLVHSPQSAVDTGKPTGYEKSIEYTGRQARR
jgi:hypothetical protein